MISYNLRRPPQQSLLRVDAGIALFFPESESEGFSFSRSTAGVKMFDPVASRGPSAQHPYNRITKLCCDGSGIWGVAGSRKRQRRVLV